MQESSPGALFFEASCLTLRSSTLCSYNIRFP
ncbi:unnamed protein product [Linum tenue]|uniref:Uncharacterized protein n=1 Tax=Linum tenue TaxID=586396 RepID=A0AAV0KPJ5_9ROSI|nr:unnamed protein product [Linum tenue]